MNKIKSLYIHFPFCRHLCNYCDFYKKIPTSSDDFSAYEKQLCDMFLRHELLMREKGYQWQFLETLYVGGGTPSLWGERGASFLAQTFRDHGICLSSSGEFTLEVNPGAWTEEGLRAWQGFGINRFSLGVQSFDPFYLKKIDRVHSLNDVVDTLSHFNEQKLDFSVDFMLGLPHKVGEPKRDILRELDVILSFEPNHLSLYILTVKGNYKYGHEMPDDGQVADEYMLVNEKLVEHGFSHYEVSNYSKPGFESRHNLRYWQCQTVAAIGPSAVGYLAEKAFRYKWKPTTNDIANEQLTDEQQKIEKIYMSLRVREGVSLNEFAAEIGNKLVKSWLERGLARTENGRLMLTSLGYLSLDSLMNELFHYC